MNIYTNHNSYVLGFHGCDKSVADKVLNSNTEDLLESTHDYDWIGSGIYFWLNGPIRGLQWAQEKQKREPNKIKEPAVIGAIIDLGVCLNTTEQECLDAIKQGYELLQKEVDISLLHNKKPDDGGYNLLRPLDCAVINYTCSYLQKEKLKVDTVLGVFQESKSLFTGSDILSKTHTQICVRNKKCILGYFLPRIQTVL